MPVSMGLLNVWTVVVASAILFSPIRKLIFVSQVVANTALILRLYPET